MEISEEKRIVVLISLIFLLYIFVVSKIDFHGPDEPLYLAYTTSIMEDGDLNIANQLSREEHPFFFSEGKMGVSKTYNFPDYHNHGGVVLWAPFYAYGKFVYFMANKLNLTWLTKNGLDSLIKCSMSFSTVVFGFFTVIFTYLFCRIFFSGKISFLSILAIFFGTPYFYFVLEEIGNAQIMASLFSILSIWFLSYAIGMKKSHWFLYGLFFSFCTIIKVDLWFQIFFVFFLFVVLFLLKKVPLENGIYFLIGIAPALVLRFINDYIKYGTLHIGEFGLLNFNSFYFFEQLFSSYHGFFYTSPIFYICFLGFIFSIANLLKNKASAYDKKMQNLFILVLFSYVCAKIFILSFRYAWGGGTPGARILLTEFPVFVLLYAAVLQEQKKSLLKIFFFAVSLICVIWNLIVISEFIAKVDLKYMLSPVGMWQRIAMLRYIVNPLLRASDLDLKISCLLPLFIAVSGIAFYVIKTARPIHPSFWYDRNQNNLKCKAPVLFTIYLFIAYAVVTTLNLSNNRRNVERLKEEGFFETAEVIGPHEFEKLENLSSLNEMIEYYKLKGDTERVKRIRSMKKELYGE